MPFTQCSLIENAIFARAIDKLNKHKASLGSKPRPPPQLHYSVKMALNFSRAIENVVESFSAANLANLKQLNDCYQLENAQSFPTTYKRVVGGVAKIAHFSEPVLAYVAP